VKLRAFGWSGPQRRKFSFLPELANTGAPPSTALSADDLWLSMAAERSVPGRPASSSGGQIEQLVGAVPAALVRRCTLPISRMGVSRGALHANDELNATCSNGEHAGYVQHSLLPSRHEGAISAFQAAKNIHQPPMCCGAAWLLGNTWPQQRRVAGIRGWWSTTT
jgi:hypothetical protein